MSRATEIYEKITLERIRKTLKDPLTWHSLLLLIGASSLITAAKISRRPMELREPIPIDTRRQLLRGVKPWITKATESDKAHWAREKPSESELLKEFTQRVQQEMRDRGLLQ